MIKKGGLLLVLLLSGKLLLAQTLVPAWGGGADQTDLSFGFSFSYISNYFKINKKVNWRDPYFDPGVGHNITDSLTSISSKNSPGFAVGFITRYSLTDHVEARITPSLVFADRSVTYTYPNRDDDVTKQVQSTVVDFPIEMKLKSDRINNFRAYLMGGVKYSVAIGTKRNADLGADPLDKLVKNVGGYGSYEVGAGFDIYFEFFKLSPEIKMSNSFGNVLVPENHPYSSPISSLGLHTLTFSLLFE
ncbi:MAG TPA: outer membrane beta-barrel protein [Mucilaginibacter sp.]|nr:outer membrane beta-barrel protein [Mucilaginibacter sp.]